MPLAYPSQALSVPQLYELGLQAGMDSNTAQAMAAVALQESSGYPTSVNPNTTLPPPNDQAAGILQFLYGTWEGVHPDNLTEDAWLQPGSPVWNPEAQFQAAQKLIQQQQAANPGETTLAAIQSQWQGAEEPYLQQNLQQVQMQLGNPGGATAVSQDQPKATPYRFNPLCKLPASVLQAMGPPGLAILAECAAQNVPGVQGAESSIFSGISGPLKTIGVGALGIGIILIGFLALALPVVEPVTTGAIHGATGLPVKTGGTVPQKALRGASRHAVRTHLKKKAKKRP